MSASVLKHAVLKKTFNLPLTLVLFVFLLTSCASHYFKPLPTPHEPFKINDLSDLPYSELWQGFVFNGEKVGFVHLKIIQMPEVNQFQILSEAFMRIRFLGIDKQISMKSDDKVRSDLTLVSFRYEQKMDEKLLIIDGKTTEHKLMINQKSGNEEKTADFDLKGSIYPSSIINLYPVLQGMGAGSRYQYHVFDPQTQSIAEVIQSVIAFEESKKLSLEPSFKVETQMHGHNVSSWINLKGETIFELGMGGVLITYKEDEKSAKNFLAESSLNKKDLILDFSLVKTNKPITCPRKTNYLEISVEGLSGELAPLQGPGQEASERTVEGKALTFFRLRGALPPKQEPAGRTLSNEKRGLYLAASHHIESNHPEIKKAAQDVVKGTINSVEKIDQLVRWVSTEIKDETVDSFSAVEVLHTRKGACQAHAMLYTAMARAAGIPTRLVGGIVYMEGMGFLYHSWSESYSNGWVAVDPTFNQVGVDATHVKLVEGHDWASLLQLGKIIGQIKIKIIDYSCDQKP
ncbi:MAG TPA: transglutaminase-like domain-containing protein [Syntrophales bacterium]|nr:transglutaminase-like domain-containing protein [Syntrophales bacterium]